MAWSPRFGSEVTLVLAEFRHRFWMPPRAHGDIIEDRTVSFLELFYDLVYVVVIGRAAHTLARTHHVAQHRRVRRHLRAHLDRLDQRHPLLRAARTRRR
jgi:hypothetical protein